MIGAKRRVAILLKLAEQAEAGDVPSAKLLLERTDATLARQELGGIDGKPIALEHAENVAAELNSDVLRDLDELARRVNAKRGNGVAHSGNGSATEH